MSLIFFGTGTFAIPALRALAGQVKLVVTQPDRPSGRGMKMQPSPMKLAALELGIQVETPEKSRAPEWAEFFESLQPEALVVASYGQILSQTQQNLPPLLQSRLAFKQLACRGLI